jgi:hypothetical protein
MHASTVTPGRDSPGIKSVIEESIMHMYKVPELDQNTSSLNKERLVSALKGVHGVANVTLKLGTSELEIESLPNAMPDSDDISLASRKAGFELGVEPTTQEKNKK